MDNGQATAMSALLGSLHMLRFMVNRGLVSPNEVDEWFSSVIEGVQGGDPAYAAMIEARLSPSVAEVRQWAEERWIGRGKTNPR